MCWQIPKTKLTACQNLRAGTVYCKRAPTGVSTPVLHANPAWPWDTLIWIHLPIYNRFRILPDAWDRLIDGTEVVCRAPSQNPLKLYHCGDAAPMTCGRTSPTSLARSSGWTVANSTREWNCPSCTVMYNQCMPCTESDRLPHTESLRLLQRRQT